MFDGFLCYNKFVNKEPAQYFPLPERSLIYMNRKHNLIWIFIIAAALVVIGFSLRAILHSFRRPSEPVPEDVLVSEASDDTIFEAIETPEPSDLSAPEAGSVAESSVPSDSGTGPAQESVADSAPDMNSSEMIPSTPVPEHVRPDLLADAMPEPYSYEAMLSDLVLLAEAYPDRMALSSAGTSLDGRDIPCVTIGDPDSQKHVILQYTIHAREYMNSLLCILQLRDCMVSYEEPVYNGKSYADLFASVCFHVIPMTNPDGVAISQSASISCIRDESLREALLGCYAYDAGRGKASDEYSYWRRWKSNARGVDLNRNFDAGWDTFEGSAQPASDRYKGTAPGSEPETQAILSLKDLYPTAACISYHSTGSVIYWDYGCSGTVYENDRALMQRVASLTGYTPSSSVSSNQDSAGCSDYFVLTLGIPAVTIETGYGECPLGAGEFSAIYSANRSVWAGIADLYQ